MLRFLHPTRQAVLAGLVLLSGPAAAQAPAPVPVVPAPAVPTAVTPTPIAPAPVAPTPVPPVAPTSPAASAIDPQITALFNQAIAAHQALPALTATLDVQSVGLGHDVAQTVTLAYQKPGQAKATVADKTGPLFEISSNGKNLTLYAVHEKEYRTQPIPAGADPIPTVLAQTRALLPRLIGQPSALSDLLAQPGIVVTLGAPETVSGVLSDIVHASLTAPGGGQIQFGFAFGQTDHLLRRLSQTATLTQAGKVQNFSHTETVTALSATPILTAADFVFVPPAGAKAATAQAAPPKVPKEPAMHDPRLVPGANPFPLMTKDITGKPLSLAQYKGKVVLMDFWATWCGPCVGEMPNVIAAYKKYHALGFEIVGISLDEDKTALTAFTAKNKMPWRQVFDGKGWQSAVPRQYGVMAIPFGLLVGRDGKIAAVDVRGPALTAAIRKALAEKPMAAKKTASAE